MLVSSDFHMQTIQSLLTPSLARPKIMTQDFSLDIVRHHVILPILYVPADYSRPTLTITLVATDAQAWPVGPRSPIPGSVVLLPS